MQTGVKILLIHSPLLVICSRLVVELSHGRVRSNPAQLCLQLKWSMWHWQELHKKRVAMATQLTIDRES